MTNATDTILVIGHRSPDTDAICSALACADLYARLDSLPTRACHLDEIGPETAWLLRRLGLEPPRPIADVYLHISDVMMADAPTLRPDDTVRQAGLLMHEHELGALPVIDVDGRLLGMLSRDQLADRYLDLLRLSGRLRRPLAAALAALDAELLAGDPATDLDGRLWMGTFSPAIAYQRLGPGAIVVIEDDFELQRAVVEAGAACLIVARGAPLADGLADMAQARGTAVMRTAHGSLTTASLLEQSSPVAGEMRRDPTTMRPDDLLSDAQQHLRSGRLACLPVVGEDGRYLGLLLRRHLIPQGRRRVILTDHNHPGQAAPGVAESEVMAIIDHHNLGGLQTLQPLTIQIEPVGCTCTLLAESYRRAGLAPAAALAGAMLGAILSDTVGFRSPTTTPRDRAAAEWLAELSGEAIEPLALALFRARLPDPPPPPSWWVSRDWKVFSFAGASVGIAQIELVDVERAVPPIADLRRELARAARAQGLSTALLLLTDIFEAGSVLVAADEAGERLAEQAFGRPFVEHRQELPGVVSRKKQVAPQIAAAAAG
jgi:manganese-dependent inorganic pyrophosphatase